MRMLSARRWRQKNPRAVSPIIATILLVAITVVLAAVLYVLISGLTKGPGNTPLGSALAFGVATQSSTGTGATMNSTYTFTIESAGGGINWNAIDMTITNASGLLQVTAHNTAVGFLVKNANGQTVCSSSGAQETTWSSGAGGSGNTAISSSQSLVVYIVGAWGNLAASGAHLNADGTGSYSGQVQASIP